MIYFFSAWSIHNLSFVFSPFKRKFSSWTRVSWYHQWRRSRVKSGGINIEKIEVVGSGEGLCPPQLGSGGLPPERKSILRQKLCNSEQVLVLLSYITAESGGLSPPVLKVGGYPPVPRCSDAYGYHSVTILNFIGAKGDRGDGDYCSYRSTLVNPPTFAFFPRITLCLPIFFQSLHENASQPRCHTTHNTIALAVKGTGTTVEFGGALW